jgi:hypothetical protein
MPGIRTNWYHRQSNYIEIQRLKPHTAHDLPKSETANKTTMKKLTLALITAALLIPSTAFASPAGDTLSKCLSDNTTGKDRTDLAKWVFMVMGTHPELKAVAPVDAKSLENGHRNVADLFTKLISTSCASEMHAVIKTEGQSGLNAAFGHLGRIAMQELMGNREVNAAFGGFVPYLDKAKLEAALMPK